MKTWNAWPFANSVSWLEAVVYNCYGPVRFILNRFPDSFQADQVTGNNPNHTRIFNISYSAYVSPSIVCLKTPVSPLCFFWLLYLRSLLGTCFSATSNYREYFTNLFSSQNLKGTRFQIVSLLMGLDVYQSATCLYTQCSIKVNHLNLVLVINASLCVWLDLGEVTNITQEIYSFYSGLAC